MKNALKNKPQYFVTKDYSMKGIVQDVDTKSRDVTGFFNVFNFVDSDGDVLLSGCCDNSIKQRGVDSEAGAKIKHALFHDLTRLPGKLKELKQETVDGLTGLWFRTTMDTSTDGNDTLIKYNDGIYDNHSIGFRYMMDRMKLVERDAHGNSKQWDNLMDTLVNPQEADSWDALWVMSEIKLFEGSTVAFGANSASVALSVGKSENKESYFIGMLDRISRLEKFIKSSSASDDAIMAVEVECSQLKQSMDSLREDYFNNTLSVKEQLLKKAQEEREIIIVPAGIDFKKLADNFHL